MAPKDPGVLRALCWGASEEELATGLAGDLLVAAPRFTTTRAITVEASAEEVWPWLVQMGHGRGGVYAYDRLLSFVGFRVRSADRVHADLQRLTVGDKVPTIPDGWHGLKTESCSANVVVSILTARHLALRRVVSTTGEPPTAFESSWALVLVPVDNRRCRLVMRRRILTRTPWGTVRVLLEAPLHMLLERGMLLGVKARVERRARRRHGMVSCH